jgi:hypothetical protein
VFDGQRLLVPQIERRPVDGVLDEAGEEQETRLSGDLCVELRTDRGLLSDVQAVFGAVAGRAERHAQPRWFQPVLRDRRGRLVEHAHDIDRGEGVGDSAGGGRIGFDRHRSRQAPRVPRLLDHRHLAGCGTHLDPVNRTGVDREDSILRFWSQRIAFRLDEIDVRAQAERHDQQEQE